MSTNQAWALTGRVRRAVRRRLEGVRMLCTAAGLIVIAASGSRA